MSDLNPFVNTDPDLEGSKYIFCIIELSNVKPLK